ncbi:hypothetical protein DTO006G1_5844 [Penicillium roqueforti]|uniref:uncharacterized protein n=1 Tax=Penicillium roqueforti TaxID=5082 RepID=UPI00190B260E|nr:uncharacterized protein LCP9604111_2944 [Penicillium roqueforti]KAF9250740.1 hypothetical protein LCP9604111_2944 [Penicillium roqueforti]KAI1836769.1 hypothetical protein CBS147337_2021 [Penicillium roqueforti]KAI2716116.1 hypothetical protein CBS147318_5967 [Penicillium roqueforti]KAI2729079.1 hypothetical protein CBS147354_1527 [Penicillium roqueforti]KAI2759431.1 hypothetical protein DTO006G1_5844 [Penicillium roqueforti]
MLDCPSQVADNLQNFHWWHERYMPGEILYHLYKYCPQASVHIASSKVALCEKINKDDSSAPQLSCIRSIESEWYTGDKNLKNLTLVSTSNWRPLSRTPRHDGDISPHVKRRELEAQRNQRGLIMLEEGNILPQVKNIQFQSMRFGPLQSTLWATQLQWHTIKHLSLIAVDWIHLLPKITAPSCFHALETLEISIYYKTDRPESIERVEQFHDFLKELPPLKMFIGYGFPQKTLGVLAKYHAKSLHHLRFRSSLRLDLDGGKSPASIHNLVNLADQLPNLLSLGINLDWMPDDEMPYDLLVNIVQHTHLQHLELNIPGLGCYHSEWPYPNLNEMTCRALIEFFDETSLNLLSLHFVIGD